MMKMKKNVGLLDAYIRLLIGFIGLSWATANLMRWRRNGFWPRVILWSSAMRLAEGLTRFCPTFFIFGIDTQNNQFKWGRLSRFLQQMNPEQSSQSSPFDGASKRSVSKQEKTRGRREGNGEKMQWYGTESVQNEKEDTTPRQAYRLKEHSESDSPWQ